MGLYLDYNASAPILQESIEAMIDSSKVLGNPSSIHRSGRQARSIIENSRLKIANMLDITNHNIVFTSGATEANSLALASSKNMKVLMSSIEHPSVVNHREDKTLIPVDSSGVILIDELEKNIKKFKDDKIFLSVMAVNNETGVIQPINKIITIIKKYDVIFHVDAVQAIGRIPIYMSNSYWKDVDLITISSHKIGGPKGIGCLVYSEKIKNLLFPIIVGAGQEKEIRAGTEAVQLISGFGVASEYANNFIINKTEKSRNLLETTCRKRFSDCVILGFDSPRVSNTTNISFKNINAENMVIALDLAGYEVSSGSACSSGKISESHVIKAMGYKKNVLNGSIRISLCYPLKNNVIKNFVETLNTIIENFKIIKRDN